MDIVSEQSVANNRVDETDETDHIIQLATSDLFNVKSFLENRNMIEANAEARLSFQVLLDEWSQDVGEENTPANLSITGILKVDDVNLTKSNFPKFEVTKRDVNNNRNIVEPVTEPPASEEATLSNRRLELPNQASTPAHGEQKITKFQEH
jgi:hypothetical protein